MHDVESKIMDEIANAYRYHDWLIRGNAAQCSPVKVIEMRVSHEHEIDRRQMMNVKARFLQSLDHLEPHRPDRIDQDIGIVRLN